VSGFVSTSGVGSRSICSRAGGGWISFGVAQRGGRLRDGHGVRDVGREARDVLDTKDGRAPTLTGIRRQVERHRERRRDPDIDPIPIDAREALRGDAADLDDSSVQPYGCPNDVGSRSESFLPQRVTDEHGGRPAREVVRRVEQPATGGPNAQPSQKVVRRDRGANVCGVRPQADRHHLGRHVRADGRERRDARAHRLVVGPEAWSAAGGLHRSRIAPDIDATQRRRLGNAVGCLQKQCVDHAEDRRGAADAETECRDDRGRERGRFAQRAHGEADVLPEALDDRFPADVVHAVSHRGRAAEVSERAAPRFLTVEARAAVRLGGGLDVLAQLVLQISVAVPPVQERPYAARQSPEHRWMKPHDTPLL
jgi:hypothetical protein